MVHLGLLESLKEFGLNPADWRLSLRHDGKTQAHVALLSHRQEPDLSLRGVCEIREKSGKPVLNWLEMRWSGV